MTDKSKSSGSDPVAATLRLLSGRDMSEAELRRRLARFGFSSSEIDGAISKCHEYNYLDDARYALQRARDLAKRGNGVGRKILLDLKQRGIDEATASAAVEKITAEAPPEQVLRELVERRFPDFDFNTASEREQRRVVSFLQRRGFPLELIFANLRTDRF